MAKCLRERRCQNSPAMGAEKLVFHAIARFITFCPCCPGLSSSPHGLPPGDPPTYCLLEQQRNLSIMQHTSSTCSRSLHPKLQGFLPSRYSYPFFGRLTGLLPMVNRSANRSQAKQGNCILSNSDLLLSDPNIERSDERILLVYRAFGLPCYVRPLFTGIASCPPHPSLRLPLPFPFPRAAGSPPFAMK